jgi:hypothetical protein
MWCFALQFELYVTIQLTLFLTNIRVAYFLNVIDKATR